MKVKSTFAAAVAYIIVAIAPPMADAALAGRHVCHKGACLSTVLAYEMRTAYGETERCELYLTTDVTPSPRTTQVVMYTTKTVTVTEPAPAASESSSHTPPRGSIGAKTTMASQTPDLKECASPKTSSKTAGLPRWAARACHDGREFTRACMCAGVTPGAYTLQPNWITKLSTKTVTVTHTARD